MRVLYCRCAGLDVHQNKVVACMRWLQGARVEKEVRTVCDHGARAHGAFAVAAGSPLRSGGHGVDGCVLEAGLACSRGGDGAGAGRRPVRNLPGRKTDVKDADWLSDLLAHGLIRSSFVPPAPQRALRDLTRTRTHRSPTSRRRCSRWARSATARAASKRHASWSRATTGSSNRTPNRCGWRCASSESWASASRNRTLPTSCGAVFANSREYQLLQRGEYD